MNTYIYDGRLGHTNLLKAIEYIKKNDPVEGKLTISHFRWQGDAYLRNRLQRILVDQTEKQLGRSFIVKQLGPKEFEEIDWVDIFLPMELSASEAEEKTKILEKSGLDLDRKFVEVIPTEDFINNKLPIILEKNIKLILYMPFKEFGQILQYIENKTEYKDRDIQVINQKLDTLDLLIMLKKNYKFI